uniref:Uncharacterized protein n=1 Tax=viral metagenome TaxID=1070528 RepID=A0A6C0KDL4_9ZZZZ
MGNTESIDASPKHLQQMIDTVATKYILTQNFKDMINLDNNEYCNKLVILTSNILNSHFTDMEVKYLAQRMKKGVIIDKMTEDKVVYFDKDQVGKLDVKREFMKKRLCIGIAKFYIKIGQLFAAIVKTVNPVYTYRNANNEIIKIPLLKKDLIPPNVEAKVKRMNLCSRRISTLMIEQKNLNKQSDDNDNNNDDNNDNNNNNNNNNKNKLTLKPHFCIMNMSKTGFPLTLQDEEGIPELKQLYIDEYDYKIGKFTGMSEASKKQYQYDLELFYTTFTGKTSMPDTIQNFSDIPLIEFHNSKDCKPGSIFNKVYTIESSNQIYKLYAKHLASMIKNTQENQDKLMSIIDELFVFKINPKTNEKEVTIHPKLTDKSLKNIAVTTRKLITNIYIQCEKDFRKGLEIFETLVENQIKKNAMQKIKNLEEQVEKTLTR